jgi:hypothetical protein
VAPAGFELQLFAAEPEIGKPLCMNWDERGRLWVAESVDYPNELQPPGQGHDRITICEDTDGDGRAATKTCTLLVSKKNCCFRNEPGQTLVKIHCYSNMSKSFIPTTTVSLGCREYSFATTVATVVARS